MKVGDIVQIRSGHSRKVIMTGNITRVSKTGRRVQVTDSHGREKDFFRDDRLGSDRTRFIQNPGAGLLGHAFNDYFEAVS